MAPNEMTTLGYIDARLDEVGTWDGQRTILTPGRYVVKALKVQGGTSQNSGKPTMIVNYEVLRAVDSRGNDDPSRADQIGRTVSSTQSIDLTKATARSRLKSILAGLQVPTDARGGFDAAHIPGKVMLCTAEINVFDRTDPNTGLKSASSSTKLIGETPWHGPEAGEAAEPPVQARPQRRAAAALPATQQAAPLQVVQGGQDVSGSDGQEFPDDEYVDDDPVAVGAAPSPPPPPPPPQVRRQRAAPPNPTR